MNEPRNNPVRTASLHKGLIPNSERTPEELREMGRKGGIKSGEVRRRNKRLRWEVQILMEVLDGLGPDQRKALTQLAMTQVDRKKTHKSNKKGDQNHV